MSEQTGSPAEGGAVQVDDLEDQGHTDAGEQVAGGADGHNDAPDAAADQPAAPAETLDPVAQAQAVLAADEQRRMEECTAKVNAVLAEYGMTLAPVTDIVVRPR